CRDTIERAGSAALARRTLWRIQLLHSEWPAELCLQLGWSGALHGDFIGSNSGGNGDTAARVCRGWSKQGNSRAVCEWKEGRSGADPAACSNHIWLKRGTDRWTRPLDSGI